MLPIIEVSEEKMSGRNKMRTFLLCRSPEHGAILRREMIGSSLTRKEIAERTLSFKKEMEEWFTPQMVKVGIDDYLL